MFRYLIVAALIFAAFVTNPTEQNFKLKVEPYEDYNVDKSLLNTRHDLEYDFKSYLDMLIEMKDWSTVSLTYCSYEAVGTNGSITTNLELDPGASGTAFGDGGESFNTGLFKDWTGSYTYQIRQMWKSFGSGCFSF